MIIELVQNSKHVNLLNENEVEIAVTIDGAYTRIFDVYGKPAGRKNGFYSDWCSITTCYQTI